MGPLRLDPRERVALAGLYLFAAIGFLLPFITSSAPDRVGRATGIQLALGSAEYEGEYLHQAFEGEVEKLLDNASLPAKIAFVAILIGLGLTILARRRAVVGAVFACSVAVIGLIWIRSATATPFSPPSTSLEYGFWLTGALIMASGAYAFLLLRRDRERADEEDPDDVTPWTRYQQPN